MDITRTTLTQSIEGIPVLGWLIYYSASSFSILHSDLVSQMENCGIDKNILKETRTKSAFIRTVNGYRTKDNVIKRKEGDIETAAVLSNMAVENIDNGYVATFNTEAIPVFNKKEKTYKNHEQLNGFDESFAHHKSMIESHQFRLMTVNYLKTVCSAITITDTGGIYFVPKSREPEMRKLEALYRKLRQDLGQVTYLTPLPQMDSAETREPMWIAMSNEVADELTVLKEDFNSLDKEISERTMAIRLKRYAKIKNKVDLYETALSGTAEQIKKELADLTELVSRKVME